MEPICDSLILNKESSTLSNNVLTIRQSMDFSIPKHLVLFSTVITFFLTYYKVQGNIGDKISKRGNENTS